MKRNHMNNTNQTRRAKHVRRPEPRFITDGLYRVCPRCQERRDLAHFYTRRAKAPRKTCRECRNSSNLKRRATLASRPKGTKGLSTRKLTAAEYEAAFGKPMPQELVGSD